MKKIVALSLSLTLVISSTAVADPKARIAPQLATEEIADDGSFTQGLKKLGKGLGGLAYCQGKTAGDFFKKEDKSRGDFVGFIGYPFAVALNVLGSLRYIGSGLVETATLGYVATGDQWTENDGINCPGNMWESSDKDAAISADRNTPTPVNVPVRKAPFSSSVSSSS